jgi:hypothetical protein
VQRLNIYANAYFYRLRDCLREDFLATAAVIGETFENVVRACLDEHAPTESSIFYAGEHRADFLSNRPVGERWPFPEDPAAASKERLARWVADGLLARSEDATADVI